MLHDSHEYSVRSLTHALATHSQMPRWLSSNKMETVKALLSDDPAMLLRESMGIAADGSNKAFPSVDVDNFLDRARGQIPVDIVEELSRYNTRHFVLAVDPSGGGGSAFAVSSMVQLPTGQIIVRCLPHPRSHSDPPRLLPAEAATAMGSCQGALPPTTRPARPPTP